MGKVWKSIVVVLVITLSRKDITLSLMGLAI